MLHYCCTSTRFETIRVVRADSLYSLHWPNSAGGVPVAMCPPGGAVLPFGSLLARHFFVTFLVTILVTFLGMFLGTFLVSRRFVLLPVSRLVLDPDVT